MILSPTGPAYPTCPNPVPILKAKYVFQGRWAEVQTVPLLDSLKIQERQLHRGNERQRKASISKCNKYLVNDPNLKRWYNNLRRGSAYTAEIYLRRLCAFCAKLALTPEEFRMLPKEAQELVEVHVGPRGKTQVMLTEMGRMIAEGLVEAPTAELVQTRS